MIPIKTLYGRPCRSPTCWLYKKDPVLVKPEIIEKTIKIIDWIGKRMKEAQDCQKSYAN